MQRSAFLLFLLGVAWGCGIDAKTSRIPSKTVKRGMLQAIQAAAVNMLSKKASVADKVKDIHAPVNAAVATEKETLNHLLYLQQERGFAQAIHRLAQVMDAGNISVHLKEVDEVVRAVSDLSNYRALDVDYYAIFKGEVEKRLHESKLDLTYEQLLSQAGELRKPRPSTPGLVGATTGQPSVDQIIYAAVNETMKRLSETGSLSLRLLTVKELATFLGRVVFKGNVELNGSLTVDQDLTVKGNTTLGDSDVDAISIHGATAINTGTAGAATTIGNTTGGAVTLHSDASGVNINYDDNPLAVTYIGKSGDTTPGSAGSGNVYIAAGNDKAIEIGAVGANGTGSVSLLAKTGGEINIGTTGGATVTLYDGANSYTLPDSRGSNDQVLTTDGAGATSWTAKASDARVKSAVVGIDAAQSLEQVNKLRPVEFSFISEMKKRYHVSGHAGRHAGLLAQEVQPVMPVLVSERGKFGDNTPLYNVEYEELSAYLVGAIQALTKKADVYERALDELKGRIAGLNVVEKKSE